MNKIKFKKKSNIFKLKLPKFVNIGNNSLIKTKIKIEYIEYLNDVINLYKTYLYHQSLSYYPLNGKYIQI